MGRIFRVSNITSKKNQRTKCEPRETQVLTQASPSPP
uniref:Uncharacterized protein n=1 Tax=Setaria viridis TaxID=4556 RepID=A0A4U6SQQ0_SETVI|nr:hypothetical protein SEVIR_9G005650v2 [Setaria viridis]